MSLKRLLIMCTVAASMGVLVFSHSYVYTGTAFPPVSVTGAPAEGSCANSGCHVGSVSDGTGFVTLAEFSSTGLTGGFVDGQTYNLVVNTNGLSAAVSGFSLTTLDQNNTSTSAGTLMQSPGQTTTFIQSSNGRSYLSHANANGEVSWLFKWQAPTGYSGPVTFYIAALKGDNDNTAAGDLTYTTTYVATKDTFVKGSGYTGIAENIDLAPEVSVFPNPVKDRINITYKVDESAAVSAVLYSLSGKQVQVLIDEPSVSGYHSEGLSLSSSVSTGLYLLRFSMGEKVFFKKIMVE